MGWVRGFDNWVGMIAVLSEAFGDIGWIWSVALGEQETEFIY